MKLRLGEVHQLTSRMDWFIIHIVSFITTQQQQQHLYTILYNKINIEEILILRPPGNGDIDGIM